MMNLIIDDILKATQGKLIRGTVNANVSKISTDSRTIEPGSLFVALEGQSFDGHNFLDQVRQKGAIGAVVSKQTDVDLPVIIEVKNTLIALGDIANYYRRKFTLPIVAITGSNGKTTTKDMTAAVLSQRFLVFKSEKNYNNQIGVPLRLLQLTEAYEIAVIEVGTNSPGEIERLSQIVAPTVGVITNIGATHLELLGTIEGVAAEKGALLEHVAHAILNADDPMTPGLARRGRGQMQTFGRRADADVSAQDIEMDAFGKPSFMLRIHQQNTEQVHLPCLGKHNISNALAAASVGVWAGLTASEIRNGLESYQPAEMRMQHIEHNGLHIINDAYNSNPESLKQALAFLSEMKTAGKRIAILGDMLELGEHSRSFHFNAGRSIPENISVLITVGAHSSEIARSAAGRVELIITCDTPKAAAEQLRKHSRAGDVVLIKGSRGMKLEQIIRDA